jgi:hypothetical protein
VLRTDESQNRPWQRLVERWVQRNRSVASALACERSMSMDGRKPAEEAPKGVGEEADPLSRLGDHPPPEDQFGGGGPESHARRC